MGKFEIQPILGSSVTEIAHFLHAWHAEPQDPPPSQRRIREDPGTIERRLSWLLIENPLSTETSERGYSVRDASGHIVGLILCFPGGFLKGDQLLVGLCSGSFFVERAARMQGFYLFKKYMTTAPYDFFFGTTCNANSGALWKKLGGFAVPNSEIEYVLPLNLEVMLPALLASKTSSTSAARIARFLGRLTNSILKRGRNKSATLTIKRCDDWQKLSELFRRHRSQNRTTTDRSAEFLQWRYGPTCPNDRIGLWLFRDKQGNEGWFAVANTVRGRHGQIRGTLLLDAVWPRDKMHFKQILPAIIDCAASAMTDAVFLQPRLGVDYAKCDRSIIARRLEGPQAFAIARKGAPRFEASLLDLVPADGDSAF